MSNLPPSGEIPRGAIRFNTDSNKPELWDGSQWAEFQLSTPNLGRGVDTQPGARGVFQGGLTPSESSTVDYINIASTGNAISFGNLSGNRRLGAAFASSTRVFTVGGFDGSSSTNEIEYFTIASTGSRVDFGSNLSNATRSNGGAANATRGLSLGGTAPKNDEIDYITMASDGSSVGSFGVPIMTPGSAIAQAYGTASPTRAVFGGGETPGRINTIQYVTISTLGDSQDFGDLTAKVSGLSAFGNATRAVFGGGEISPNFLTTMQYVTISSTGNAVSFGELTQSGGLRQHGSASSPTRGVFAGGSNDTPSASTVYNDIQYVEIPTGGNAIDFGDLSGGTGRWQIMNGNTSNAHGGL